MDLKHINIIINLSFSEKILKTFVINAFIEILLIVKLRQGSGKDWQGMAVKAKGLKA